MSGILNAFSGGTYSGLPDAPTIGTATATGATTATVAFTAPTNTGGLPITGYQAISSPGSITATGASSPITVTGLTGSTSYTFQVRAQNAIGYGSYSGSSNSITTPIAPSSQSYTSAGTYSWVAPTGVTSVSVIAIGPGGSTAAGGLGYRNNYSVTPGNSYTVVVGAGCSSCNSYFVNQSTAMGGNGRCSGANGYAGTGGSMGGTRVGGSNGGAGAAGYGGAHGANTNSGAGSSGNCGVCGGGGSGGTTGDYGCGCYAAAGGGGTGIFGKGANGTAGGSSGSTGGGGGSGGGNGRPANACGFLKNSAGGAYGGGRGNGVGAGGIGGVGAVRIVWPGTTRQFPSTCVGTP